MFNLINSNFCGNLYLTYQKIHWVEHFFQSFSFIFPFYKHLINITLHYILFIEYVVINRQCKLLSFKITLYYKCMVIVVTITMKSRQGVMFIVTNETLVFSLVFHLPKLKPKLIFKLFFRQIGVFNTVFNVPMTQWLKTLVRKFGLTHIILLQ